MCLITNQKKPHTATCDMVVYKLLRKNASSLYHSTMTYELGKLYKTKIMLGTSKYCFDDEDTDEVTKAYGCNWSYDYSIFSFGEGFHSAIYPDRFTSTVGHSFSGWQGKAIFECIIPKGSKYYKNPSGLIVSNKIIVIKPINNEVREN